MKSKALCSIMSRHREQTLPLKINPSTDWLFSATDDDDITVTSPGDDIWKKFGLMLTPPDSPPRDVDDEWLEAQSSSYEDDDEDIWLSTPICYEKQAKQIAALSPHLIQDCMWSGSDGEKARTSRIRKVSLSELTMLTASTACVDPTSISSSPRAQNQLEHSYSLTTPEPLRVPAIMTPSSTDDSESEEDVIDVVTIDTKTQYSPTVPLLSPSTVTIKNNMESSQYKVRHNLQAVANRLTRDSYKRPKCMSDHDFALPSKKSSKKYHSMSSSMLSSQNSSDSEDFEGKRSQHNVMERQRRNDLKNSLLSLRSCLPTLNSQERAPKVVILSHATDYVKDLRRTDNHLANEYRALKLRNAALKHRLDYIQSKIGLNTL